MPFVAFNPNPKAKRVGDCSVRAICKALDQDWDTAFLELAVIAMREYDMPSANYIWGLLLQEKGFSVRSLPVICPNCSTVAEFCRDHPEGTFVLVCDGELIAVDGNYGKNSVYAMKNFQRGSGIKVDGWVGEETWNHLLH